MVLKNLLTGQQWRNRHREHTYGHGERGGKGEMYGKMVWGFLKKLIPLLGIYPEETKIEK